ncbi:hypothetical protein VFPPC_17590 [Pochonia chlamydosporia 170]|uniref:Uncharacterized protein n=1 Tax=Pochonia chlamydosporia 170 TaxID=1380566 RepID=A0A219AR36_METCM|nr:hypothetical protein VFPPC_17590 [Pochonia chlamydosporia 170]OWT43247.1 hypothetical protein VFPPC_17590 [Pochonia chlamydosporia 170]
MTLDSIRLTRSGTEHGSEVAGVTIPSRSVNRGGSFWFRPGRRWPVEIPPFCQGWLSPNESKACGKVSDEWKTRKATGGERRNARYQGYGGEAPRKPYEPYEP